MTYKKTAIASLLLLFLVTGCTSNTFSENPPNTTAPNSNEKTKEEVKAPYIRVKHPFDEQVKVPVKEAQGLTNVEIVKKLWSIYLECFKKAPITNPDKLKDYKIVQVDEVNNDYEHEIVFDICYSVLPCAGKSGAWSAGNGTYNTEDGWVVRKSTYVRLVLHPSKIYSKNQRINMV